MSALSAIRSRWSLVTPRERAGLAALVALLAIGLCVSAFDWAADEAASLGAARDRRAELEATFAVIGTDAQQRHAASEAGRVWRLSHQGLDGAEDAIVAAVREMATQANLAAPEASLAEPISGGARVRRVRVRLSAAFEWTTFVAFLAALEASEVNFVVEGVEVAGEGAPAGLAMLLSAPAVEGEPGT